MRIDIIDDDLTFHYITKKQLAKLGLKENVRCHFNVADALAEFCNEGLPDLLIIDVNLPVQNGWELVEKLKLLNIAEGVKVYMVSYLLHHSIPTKAQLSPVIDGFFLKPLQLNDLQSMLL